MKTVSNGCKTDSYLFTACLPLLQLFGKPLPALFATILTSAFVHEYVIAVTVQFASPILILEFAGLGGKLHHLVVGQSGACGCVW